MDPEAYGEQSTKQCRVLTDLFDRIYLQFLDFVLDRGFAISILPAVKPQNL